MQDFPLTAKLAAGDMVAIEAKYHAKCILAFKRKYSAFVASSSGPETVNDGDRVSEARAFAELTYYMESSTENGTFLFKMSNLHELHFM